MGRRGRFKRASAAYTGVDLGYRLPLGSKDLNVVIKEIENEEELSGYLSLTEYHYRGGAGIGKCVPLVASIDSWQLPKIVGFIELSSSFLVNIARKKIFDTPFSDPERNVAWFGGIPRLRNAMRVSS